MRKWPVPAPSGWPMRRVRVKWLGPTQNIRTGGGGFACLAPILFRYEAPVLGGAFDEGFPHDGVR